MYEKDSRPDDHLRRLQRIVEDIPSGVSANVMKSILKVSHTEELLSSLNSVITSTVNQALERIWIDLRVSENLKHLQELEDSASKEDAWRPSTGEADVKHIIADCLIKQKKELMRQIELVEEETEALKPIFQNFREKTKNQLREISTEEKASYRDNPAKMIMKQIV